MVQMPCFLLGILLYNSAGSTPGICKRVRDGLAVVLLGIFSLYLFYYANGTYRAVLLPTVVGGIGYVILKYLLAMEQKCQPNKCFLWNVLSKFGQKSYYLYLVHVFFVWTVPLLIKGLAERRQIQLSYEPVYIGLLPFMFLGSYVCALVYERIVRGSMETCRKLIR